MMNHLLKLGLYGLGLSAILIGGSIALFGSHSVVTFFENALSIFYVSSPTTDLASPNVDSELRFYSVMFVFYGGVLVQTARNLELYSARVPLLLAVFFLAGVARLLGCVFVGVPQMLFLILMVIELTLPVILFICWLLRKPRNKVQ